MNIQLTTDPVLVEKTTHLATVGEVICKVFFVNMPAYARYERHLAVAQQTLLEVKKESVFFEITVDFQKLEYSGTSIAPAEFIGWQLK